MTFTLRTLLFLVLIVGIFAAAFTYENRWWELVVVNLTIATLIFGTLGVWLARFHRAFWIPFCFVGWLYLAMAFTSPDWNRLHPNLPGTRVTWLLWNGLSDSDGDDGLTIGPDGTFTWVRTIPDSKTIARYSTFLNIVQSAFTLLAAGLAGGVTAFCLQKNTPFPK